MSSRLPPEFFNKLDPTYQSKILLLEHRLNSTENPDKKQEYLDSFYENFLMPGKFIDEMLKQRDEYFIDMASTYRRFCHAFSKATKKKVYEMMNEDVKTRADHFYFLYYYSDTVSLFATVVLSVF
uniref:Uncharacterized protein n=1 Tax=Panagrolaimus davidi TaxID=227884 RepID=A0A914PTX4_9BILA